MPGMPYLVSLALLVALFAWAVGVYNNLDHLRTVVCNFWGQWSRATHYRNESLNDFAVVFAAFLPQDASLPRSLQHLAAESERSVSQGLELLWSSDSDSRADGVEDLLRQAVVQSVQLVEESSVMREHEHLQRVCSRVSVSLFQQDQVAELFNRAVRDYNQMLKLPSARLLAPLFGFVPALPLRLSSTQNARSS